MILSINSRKINDSKKLLVSFQKQSYSIIGKSNSFLDNTYIEVDNNSKENSCFVSDVIDFFGSHYEITKVDNSNNSNIIFSGIDRELELKDYSLNWGAANKLLDYYEKNRSTFFDDNKGIDRIIVIPSSKSSYQIYKNIDNRGYETDWMILEIALKGITAISDSAFLKYITKELYKGISTAPDEIKLREVIDGIDLSKMKVIETDGKIVAFDRDLKKYFYTAYKDALEQKGLEEDIKHGVKYYDIKRKRGN